MAKILVILQMNPIKNKETFQIFGARDDDSQMDLVLIWIVFDWIPKKINENESNTNNSGQFCCYCVCRYCFDCIYFSFNVKKAKYRRYFNNSWKVWAFEIFERILCAKIDLFGDMQKTWPYVCNALWIYFNSIWCWRNVYLIWYT